MSVSQPPDARRWTAHEVRALITEWHSWPRYECIDGELLVTPGAGYPHQRAVRELILRLDPYVRAHRLGEVLLAPADIGLEPDSLVQPDVFVLPEGRGAGARGWRDVTGLLLAIEVLSPGSVRNDRLTKRRYYLRNGVPEYWVVDADAGIVERYRPGDNRVDFFDERIKWHPQGASDPLVIDLVPFFAEVGGTD